MNISDADKSLLTKFTQVAQKIIYNPQRASALAKLMDSPDGLPQVVLTVMSGIEQQKPIPPNIRPMLAVNIAMVVLDIAQEVEGKKIPPQGVMAAITSVLQAVQKGGQQQPAQQPAEPEGMLAKMQGQEQEQEPAGEGMGPDNTPMHENAEPAATEQAEGAEEDAAPDEANDNIMTRMKRAGAM